MGFEDKYLGLEQLADPEKYVDMGIALSTLSCERYRLNEIGGKVNIWTHIKGTNVSRHFYYVCQDWYWSAELNPTKKYKEKRKLSFLGFYRKFCEADIYELLRLKRLAHDQMAVNQIEEQMLFCDFLGNPSMTVCFKDVAILNYVLEWVSSDHEREQDED